MKEKERKVILFAGINGAGKTSLYNTIRSRTDLGVRVSLDDVAGEMGDWKDAVVQVRAGVVVMRQVSEYIRNGVTFNQETTLPGAVIVTQLTDAKKAGYTVVLYFVGVQGVRRVAGDAGREGEGATGGAHRQGLADPLGGGRGA